MTQKRVPGTDPRDRMADYLAGSMSREESREWEERILQDPELAEALYADLETTGALKLKQKIARAGARVATPVRPHWRDFFRGLRWAIPAAAVLAAVLLIPRILTWQKAEEGQIFRGEESALRLIDPVEQTVQPPVRFTWTQDPAASAYRLELLDQDMRMVYTSVSRDTFLVLGTDAFTRESTPGMESPREKPEGAHPRFYWRVVPLTEVGTERSAPAPTPFTLDLP